MKKVFHFYLFIIFFAYCSLTNLTTITAANCPDNIEGFTALGEYNNHNYYLSQQQAIPVNAQAIAASHGGYLSSITTQAENDFLQQYISEMTYIGLSDAQVEGGLTWENEEVFDYQNFNICSFCNSNIESMDFTIMHPWDGAWSFSNYWNPRPFIMEIACEDTPQTACSFLASHPLNIGDNYLRETYATETENGYTFGTGYQLAGTNDYIYESTAVDSEGQLISNESTLLPNLYLSESKEFYYDFELNNTTIILKAITLAGAEMWSSSITLTPPNNEQAAIVPDLIIKEMEDEIFVSGNYVINGSDSNRPFLIRTDLSGNITWQRFYETYSGLVEVRKTHVLDRATDGSYYLTITSAIMGDISKTLIKLDAEGFEVWSTFLAFYPGYDITEYVGQTPDGTGLYFTFGIKGVYSNLLNSSIVKYNTVSGSQSWTYFFSPIPNPSEFFNGVVVTEDGGTMFGFSSNHGEFEYHQYGRLDADANTLWAYCLPNGLPNYGATLATSDGGFIFQNIHDGQLGLFKVNNDGEFTPLCSEENYADLSLGNLSGWHNVSGDLFPGDSVHINFDIHNNGFETVTENYSIDLYLRHANFSEDLFVKSSTSTNTPFGITFQVINFAVPFVPAGAYELVLVVDGTEIVTESNELNNIITSYGSRQISAGNTVSLSLDVPCAETFPQHGQIITWPVTVTNNGSATSLPDVVQLWKSTTGSIGNSYPILTVDLPSIPPGESHVVYLNYPMPTDQWELPTHFYFSSYFVASNFNNGSWLSHPVDYYCKKTDSDLGISIQPESETFDEERLISYDVQVTNNGPDTAYNVIAHIGSLTYFGYSNVSVTDGQFIAYGIQHSGTIVFLWYLEQLAPGVTETLTIPDHDVTHGGLIQDIQSYPTSVYISSGHSTEMISPNNQADFTFTFSETTPTCNTTLTGFTFLGESDNHNYFISNEKANWQNASNIAVNNDGYLASFATLSENNFVLNQISEIVLVGGKDENCDGTFEWADGSNSTFNNISGTCSSSDFYTNMNFWNGGLSFDNQWVERKYILEVPCLQNRNTKTLETSSETVLTPKLYPNPVSEDLFIELETGTEASNLLEIYNLSGQIVAQKDFSFVAEENRIKLDVHSLQAGIYFIKIISPSGKHQFKTMRFVKM